jgi:hypothetical protein
MRVLALERGAEEVEQDGEEADLRKAERHAEQETADQEYVFVHGRGRVSEGHDYGRLRKLERKCHGHGQEEVRLTAMEQRERPENVCRYCHAQI